MAARSKIQATSFHGLRVAKNHNECKLALIHAISGAQLFPTNSPEVLMYVIKVNLRGWIRIPFRWFGTFLLSFFMALVIDGNGINVGLI